mmetsp:Transcript_26939/g.70888  ORF Transcript_26939/g.70888 Transcript_26939/m.70888 type:complete len:98 (-) Transcript_26939:226-519(-)
MPMTSNSIGIHRWILQLTEIRNQWIRCEYHDNRRIKIKDVVDLESAVSVRISRPLKDQYQEMSWICGPNEGLCGDELASFLPLNKHSANVFEFTFGP